MLGLNVINDKVGRSNGIGNFASKTFSRCLHLLGFGAFSLQYFQEQGILYSVPCLESTLIVSVQIAVANYHMLLFSLQAASVQNPDQ